VVRAERDKREKGGRGSGLVDGGDEFGPVEDAGCHVAAEDPVVFGGLNPGVFDVVDFELDVWRGEGGEVGAEVVADDLFQFSKGLLKGQAGEGEPWLRGSHLQ
jgi:hypothetical protein